MSANIATIGTAARHPHGGARSARRRTIRTKVLYAPETAGIDLRDGPALGQRRAVAQPVLRTERMLLVPLADRHLELEVALDADAEVLRYLFAGARTREQVLRSHEGRLALGRKVDGLGYWMAFVADCGARGSSGPAEESAGEFAGLLMLPPAHGPDQPDDRTVAELGYRMVRRFWRQGLAGEASRELLRHAFDDADMSRVIAQTMTVNAGSRAVMASVGMTYVRTYHPTFDEAVPGWEEGEVEYELTRAVRGAQRHDLT